jgi:hypothetical protein
MSGYGTLPNEKEFEWEKNAEPRSLLIHMCISFGKQLAALLLLFWQIVHQKALLMTCDARVIGNWVYACEYTKTYVRCFPLLAASVVLLVGNRSMLQQRLYYGLLKRGALLDFKNAKAWHDPLFFILLVCFMQGALHFVLDIFVMEGGPMTHYMEDQGIAVNSTMPHQTIYQEMKHEAENAVKNFALPSAIFFAFLVASYDIEAILVSLSKYFEEDPRIARSTLGNMHILDEDAVLALVPKLSLKTSTAKTTPNAVYNEILQLCPDRDASCHDTKIGIEWRLFSTLWPANILLDPRLIGSDAVQFRHLAITVKCFSVLVMTGTFVYFVMQSWKDFTDVRAGMIEDSTSLFVLILHAGIVAVILQVVVKSLLVVFKPTKLDHELNDST